MQSVGNNVYTTKKVSINLHALSTLILTDNFTKSATRYPPGGGETICPPPRKIAAHLRPQAAHGGRRWLSCHAYSLVRQLRHGTDRRTDRAIPKCPSWAKGIITISAGTLRNDTLLPAPCTNHKQNNQSCKKIAESRLEHSNS